MTDRSLTAIPPIDLPAAQRRARRRKPAPNVGSWERVASAVAGTVLSLVALRARGPARWVAGLAGAAMLHRGSTGRCAIYKRLGITSEDAVPRSHLLSRHLRASGAATIGRDVEEVFDFWRDPRNLEGVLTAVQQAERLGDEGRWRWVCKVGRHVLEFETRITVHQAPRRIDWRTAPGSPLEHSGQITFAAAPGDRGTEVRISAEFLPRGPLARVALRRLLPVPFEDPIDRALRTVKAYLEAGEVSTASPSLAQASAPIRERAMWLGRIQRPDKVDEASQESFPASDAPAWAPGTASGAAR